MKRSYINWIVFFFLMLISGCFINWQIKSEIIMINETVAITLVTISPLLKEYKIVRIGYAMLIILFFLLFSILRFSYTVEQGSTSVHYETGRFSGIGFSPIVFLFLLAYMVINSQVVIDLYRFAFRGTDQEVLTKRNREINFYYDKFHNLPPDELSDVFGLYNNYPEEAQTALKKIQEERQLK